MTKSRLWVGVLLFGVLEVVGENLALFLCPVARTLLSRGVTAGAAAYCGDIEQTIDPMQRGYSSVTEKIYRLLLPPSRKQWLMGPVATCNKQQDILRGTAPLRRTWGDKQRKAIGFCV